MTNHWFFLVLTLDVAEVCRMDALHGLFQCAYYFILPFCVRQFYIAMTKYLRLKTQREEGFIVAQVSQVSVRHGWKGVMKHRSSHHGDQEAERDGRPVLLAFSFPPFHSVWVPSL
jgi:hypothetical protein